MLQSQATRNGKKGGAIGNYHPDIQLWNTECLYVYLVTLNTKTTMTTMTMQPGDQKPGILI